MRTFDDVCSLLEDVLSRPTRQSIVAEVSGSGDLGKALLRLREGMRSDTWKLGAQPFDLARIIRKYDRKTRQNGFHVLHDWDGVADKVNEDTIPVDVLHYVIEKRAGLEERGAIEERGSAPASPAVVAVLLDYYFLHLLALLSIRVWDEGDADANLDRLEVLLQRLQGPDGSGQQFAADAETLILIGTSHFELHERGYGVLLDKVRTLNRAHQARVALGHAASMGSHLRFGFEATYGRDTVNMRDDNVADYPWLCFALATLMNEYARMREAGADAVDASPLDRDRLIEAMLNGLCADARAFVGAPPTSLANCEVERSGFRDTFLSFKPDLLADFERHRPSHQTYSPLCFFFNFSHNVVKGVVIDALLRGQPWALSLNDLLTRSTERTERGHGGRDFSPAERGCERRDVLDLSDSRNVGVEGSFTTSAESKLELATTLMGYARDNPHRIRGRLRPVIVYDTHAGREAFAVAMRKLTSP